MSSPPPIDLPRGFDDLRGRAFNRRYTVSEVLTVGRSHVVFGATDRKGAGQVLLRVMRPSVLRDPPTVERFKKRLQEARRASPLRARPSVDAGEAKDGKLYLVCKRPPGRSLEKYMAAHEHGRLPWPIVKKLLLSFIELLRAAHDRRIVHGGMMPDSFWIEETEETGPVAYLVDLGANPEVRLDGETAEAQKTTALTADMEFTAPETIISTTYDQRTDVYLLGLLGYFMLVGQPPFHGKNHFQVASEQINGTVPPIRELVAGVPEQAEALIGRMLAKEAEERPQTMGGLERDLAGVPELATAPKPSMWKPMGPAPAEPIRPFVPAAVPQAMRHVPHVEAASSPEAQDPEATEVIGMLAGPPPVVQVTTPKAPPAPAAHRSTEQSDGTEIIASIQLPAAEPTAVLPPSDIGGEAPPRSLPPAFSPEPMRPPVAIEALRPAPPLPIGADPGSVDPEGHRPGRPGTSAASQETLTIPISWIGIACGMAIVCGVAIGLWLALY